MYLISQLEKDRLRYTSGHELQKDSLSSLAKCPAQVVESKHKAVKSTSEYDRAWNNNLHQLLDLKRHKNKLSGPPQKPSNKISISSFASTIFPAQIVRNASLNSYERRLCLLQMRFLLYKYQKPGEWLLRLPF